MERRVSEPKPVPRGITIGEGSEKKKRRKRSQQQKKKNKNKRVQKGIDASGKPICEFFSKVDILGDNVQTKQVQSEVDASRGKMGGHSERPLIKLPFDMLGISRTPDGPTREAWDKIKSLSLSNPLLISVCPKYAQIALKSYEKSKGVEHKILRVLFVFRKSIIVPGYNGVKQWCHVCFTAKPKNTDDRPQFFFGEIMADPTTRTHNVIKCCTFEPSGAGLTYGCGFCPQTPRHLHPAFGYVAGLPSSTYPKELDNDYLAAIGFMD